MTFSTLISGVIPSHDKYNTRPGKVTRVIQHHWADITMGGLNSLASANRRASVNYLVLNTGMLLGQVPEEFRPWTSSSSMADNPSITIECQNSTVGPDWKVSNAALGSLEHLVADIAKRHAFGTVTRTNYRGHREFASTACPGPYLYPRLQSICDAANRINSNPVPSPVPLNESNTEEIMLVIVNKATGNGALVYADGGWVFITSGVDAVAIAKGARTEVINLDKGTFDCICCAKMHRS